MLPRSTLPLPRLALLLSLVLAACLPLPAPPEAAPTPSPNIKRGKIDIAYTAIATTSYAKPTSRELLGAALEAIREEVRRSGGRDIDAVPNFSDATAASLEDFRRFAATVEELAVRNPGLAPDRVADLAIEAMVRLKTDCHTYYVKRPRAALEATRARPRAAPLVERSSHVQLSMLPGGIALIRFREFTHDILDETRKALDEGLARGAKAWLFDWRGNVGGFDARPMAMWFLNGGIMLRELDRTDRPDLVEAKKELRLPEPYQLPIAIVLDRRAGSAPEVVALALRDMGRATIVGERSRGCLGSTALFTLPDNHTLGVQAKEVVGGVTGLRANGVGIRPDIEVTSGDPVAVAAEHLRTQVAAR